jgi:hypothetical protein
MLVAVVEEVVGKINLVVGKINLSHCQDCCCNRRIEPR